MNVLLVTDLSEAGLLSVEGLCACGSPGFGHVTLLHVIDLDLYTAGGSIPQIADLAEQELGKAASELVNAGFEVDTRVEVGPTLDTIKRLADETNAGLIVSTSLGKGAVAGRLLGSTAERLPLVTNRPVLIERVKVEAGSWCRLGTGSPFERVLIGIDVDDDPEVIARGLRALPGVQGARFVHVAREAGHVPAVDELLGVLRNEMDIEGEVVVGDDPAEVLLTEARKFDATVIAVSSCGHGMLHRGVLGSVAHSVASNADRAVLLLPATE